MLKIFQSLWIGTELSTMEILSINSFLSKGHSFHLYVYNDIKNVPSGTVIKDAEKILSRSRIFKYKNHDSYAGFANQFRYKLLLERGEYWVDADVVLLRDFVNEQLFVFASQLQLDRESVFLQCNPCLMRAPKNSEVMEYCFDQSRKYDSQELYWGQIGPELLTQAVIKYKLTKCVMEPDAVCPISWWDWKDVLSDCFEKNLNNSFCLHLWNDMWRRSNYDKSGSYSTGCLYEKLKKLYTTT